MLENNYRIKIETAAVIFDLGQSTSTPVIDTISDSLAFHSVLIDEHKPQFRNLVNDEIEKCNNSAKEIWKLSVNLQKSAGASGDDLKGDNEKTQFYSYIDKPFRMWLEGLDPNMDIDDCRREANELFYKSAKKFGERLAAGYNDNAVFGRVVGNNDDKKNKFHSSAKSINMYIGALKKIYNIKAGVILK